MKEEEENDGDGVYLDSGGVTGVGLMMLELRLLRLFKLLACDVAAEKREEVEIMGREAGRGTAPGGRLPRTVGKNGGLEAPIEERAAEAAAVWRKYISSGDIPAPAAAAPAATRGAG